MIKTTQLKGNKLVDRFKQLSKPMMKSSPTLNIFNQDMILFFQVPYIME